MAYIRRAALLRLAVLACCAAVAVAKKAKEPQWETINYDCRCGASPVPLGAAATIAECQAKVAGAKRSAGFYEAATRKCHSAKSCDTCWSSSENTITVFGQKNQAPKMCRYDKAVPGVVTTFAGSGQPPGKKSVLGPRLKAKLKMPVGPAVSPDGRTLFFADQLNHAIRAINIKSGMVTTLAGSGAKGAANGQGKTATFNQPVGVATSPDGSTLFVADRDNNMIRKIDIKSGGVTTLAGDGTKAFKNGKGKKAQFNWPLNVVVSPDESTLFVADQENSKVRTIEIKSGKVTTLAVVKRPYDVAVSTDGRTVFAADLGGKMVMKVDVKSRKVTKLADVKDSPFGVAASPDGRTVFAAAYGKSKIEAIDIKSGKVTTVAGSGKHGKQNGKGKAATFQAPSGVAVSPDGRTVFVADQDNYLIRKIALGCKQ